MSRDSVLPSAEIEVRPVQRRRRWFAAEKQRLVEETLRPGMNVSLVAQEHRISPSLLFRWRKLATAGDLEAMGADESVVPISDLKVLQHQVRELQRLLGKKTMENEILKEATEIAREKKWLVRSP
jgi:transposase